MTVDSSSPVTSLSCRAPVIYIEDDVAPARQEVMEHVLAIVGRPPVVYIVQISSAMDEDDRRAVRLGPEITRTVDPCGDLDTIASSEVDDLRCDPAEAPPLLGSRVRSEEHTSELQSRGHLVCRLLL